MVVPFTVYRRYQGGLVKFRNLPDESAQDLLASLRDVPWKVSARSLSSSVASKVDTVSASDVEEIVTALLHIHSIRDEGKLPVSDLAEGIARGVEGLANDEDKATLEDKRETFQTRLTEALSIEQLRTIARAAGLLFENENSATDTRIITDIRPIFEQESPHVAPAGAMVVHTLRIGYVTNGEDKSFFVALDADDIQELIEQLQRANSKTESLRSVLKAAQVDYVDTD